MLVDFGCFVIRVLLAKSSLYSAHYLDYTHLYYAIECPSMEGIGIVG